MDPLLGVCMQPEGSEGEEVALSTKATECYFRLDLMQSYGRMGIAGRGLSRDLDACCEWMEGGQA
jgi:hypothetical protein